MKAVLNFNGKKIEINNIERCDSLWKQFRGLMFRGRDANSLLFEFRRETKISMHSLFCPLFMAVWLDDKNRIIEKKLVLPFKLWIKPERRFRKLLEIPVNPRNLGILNFLDEKEKDL